jgi:hypothetical protein
VVEGRFRNGSQEGGEEKVKEEESSRGRGRNRAKRDRGCCPEGREIAKKKE